MLAHERGISSNLSAPINPSISCIRVLIRNHCRTTHALVYSCVRPHASARAHEGFVGIPYSEWGPWTGTFPTYLRTNAFRWCTLRDWTLAIYVSNVIYEKPFCFYDYNTPQSSPTASKFINFEIKTLIISHFYDNAILPFFAGFLGQICKEK